MKEAKPTSSFKIKLNLKPKKTESADVSKSSAVVPVEPVAEPLIACETDLPTTILNAPLEFATLASVQEPILSDAIKVVETDVSTDRKTAKYINRPIQAIPPFSKHAALARHDPLSTKQIQQPFEAQRKISPPSKSILNMHLAQIPAHNPSSLSRINTSLININTSIATKVNKQIINQMGTLPEDTQLSSVPSEVSRKRSSSVLDDRLSLSKVEQSALALTDLLNVPSEEEVSIAPPVNNQLQTQATLDDTLTPSKQLFDMLSTRPPSPINNESLESEVDHLDTWKPTQGCISKQSILERTLDAFLLVGRPGDVPVVNDDALIRKTRGTLETILYTGCDRRHNYEYSSEKQHLKLFVLPRTSNKHLFYQRNIVIPYQFLSCRNIAFVSRAIWGCDVYTDDSDIFSCVVHSGAFVPFDIDIFTPTSDEQQGGHGLEPVIGRRNYDGCASMDLMVTIQMLPRLQQYFESMRFGLRSRGWGSGHDGVSFKVVKCQEVPRGCWWNGAGDEKENTVVKMEESLAVEV